MDWIPRWKRPAHDTSVSVNTCPQLQWRPVHRPGNGPLGINSRDEDSYAVHGVVPSSHRITSRRTRTHESRAERVIR
eukprot:COSAG01_NODE_52008_length_350_cov_0.597610_1_plen_76_part_01